VTNGAKWLTKWADEGKNVKFAKWDKWDKWMPNGCQMASQMVKNGGLHRFGAVLPNGRAYVLIYAPIWQITKCPRLCFLG
jgi:hypothetical protein